MKRLRASITLIAGITVLTFARLVWAIEPNYEKSFIEMGQQVLKPASIAKSWRMIYRVGESRYAVAERKVARLPTSGEKPVWTAESDDGRHLHWLVADEACAYLVGYEADKEGSFQKYEEPPRVRRLDLKNGRWLSDLPIELGGLSLHKPKGIVSVSVGKDEVAVLTTLSRKKLGMDEEERVAAYELRLIRKGSDKLVWSKRFSASGERPYTGGYVWGIPSPQYAGSAIQHLSWMDDKLLVCPEAMQPIYCLNPDTGSEIWKLDRVWEFQRGFIGPSVWSHFISRFGIEEFGVKERSVDGERRSFDERYHCALIAGPIPVQLHFERGADTHSIFTAVVRGPRGSWAGYLSDCLVYELDDSGKPISIATLPQMVDGAQFCVQQDGVVWRCQNDTFVKVGPSPSSPVVTMGGGGSDGVSHVRWLRQLQYRAPEAWLVSGKAGDPVAFTQTHAFCLPDGGYITRSDDHVCRFPITVLDLTTGVDTILVLCIPFEGRMPAPTTNYSMRTLPDGTTSCRTGMPWELYVTHLSAYGNELDITLSSDKHTASITFDMGNLVDRAVIGTRQSSGDAMGSARARVKALKLKDLNEALRSAGSGADASFIKALLEAGADPKAVSGNGWTALMTAATYGTAAMVDLLIQAGSDVNASDKNCGGQSVLMWAARGGRDSRRKVQSLLNAGPDINATSSEGYNALMSAAMAEHLETVELLLQKGMKASYRNKGGETVLMVASRSGDSRVVKVLIDAGADVNATDGKGKTALMHAAEGVNTAEAIKVLLKANASPVAKDNEGHTALQIARASNYFGAAEVAKLLENSIK